MAKALASEDAFDALVCCVEMVRWRGGVCGAAGYSGWSVAAGRDYLAAGSGWFLALLVRVDVDWRLFGVGQADAHERCYGWGDLTDVDCADIVMGGDAGAGGEE